MIETFGKVGNKEELTKDDRSTRIDRKPILQSLFFLKRIDYQTSLYLFDQRLCN